MAGSEAAGKPADRVTGLACDALSMILSTDDLGLEKPQQDERQQQGAEAAAGSSDGVDPLRFMDMDELSIGGGTSPGALSTVVASAVQTAIHGSSYNFTTNLPPWVVVRSKPLRVLVCAGCDQGTLSLDDVFPELYLFWAYYQTFPKYGEDAEKQPAG